MKRALSAAVLSGVLVFAVPQAAFADHDHGEEATQPEGTSPEPDRAEQGRPYGDREQHDDDEGSILF